MSTSDPPSAQLGSPARAAPGGSTPATVDWEQQLAELRPDDRPAAFARLLTAELLRRQEQGERPGESDYLPRFPEYAELIAAVFRTDPESHSLAGESTFSLHGSALPNFTMEIGEPAPPPRIGRYELISIVGKGGFAQVWQAQDPMLQRIVAVKVLRPDRVAVPNANHLMLAEARRIANLSLPGLVPIYDIVEDDSKCCIVSKFVARGSLADRLKLQRFKPAESASIVAQLAETLHGAHLRDVVHRDIKPGNILMDDDDTPLLADFGLAVTEREQLVEPRHVSGTWRYMSPEQARGEGHLVDARTDIYSLGMLFYELLTGRVAFLGTSQSELIEQILKRPPRPPRTIDDSIHPELERICLKSLAKAPADRYSTAKDMAADLRTWLRVTASPAPAPLRIATPDAPIAMPVANPQPAPVVAAQRLPQWIPWVAAAAFGGLALVFAIGSWNPSAPKATEAVQVEPIATSPAVASIAASPLVSPPPGPTKPALEQEFDRWHMRFGTRPQQLVFPGYTESGSLLFDEEKRALVISSHAPRLLELGTLATGKHLISVGLGQPTWIGSLGIFYDFHVVEVDGKPEAQFETIGLVTAETADRVRTLRVQRTHCRISSNDGTIYPKREYGEQTVPWPTTDVLPRLEVQFDGQQITSMRWAGAELPKIVKRTLTAKQLGTWGLLHAHGTSWYQEPRCTSIISDPKPTPIEKTP